MAGVAAGGTTRVTGVREAVASLEAAAADLQNMPMGALADAALETMRPLIPTGTGKLRRSARTATYKGAAVVRVGGPTLRYSRIVNARARFVERTDAAMETKAVSVLETELDTITRKHGLQ